MVIDLETNSWLKISDGSECVERIGSAEQQLRGHTGGVAITTAGPRQMCEVLCSRQSVKVLSVPDRTNSFIFWLHILFAILRKLWLT
jgi:hypothetical protein